MIVFEAFEIFSTPLTSEDGCYRYDRVTATFKEKKRKPKKKEYWDSLNICIYDLRSVYLYFM